MSTSNSLSSLLSDETRNVIRDYFRQIDQPNAPRFYINLKDVCQRCGWSRNDNAWDAVKKCELLKRDTHYSFEQRTIGGILTNYVLFSLDGFKIFITRIAKGTLIAAVREYLFECEVTVRLLADGVKNGRFAFLDHQTGESVNISRTNEEVQSSTTVDSSPSVTSSSSSRVPFAPNANSSEPAKTNEAPTEAPNTNEAAQPVADVPQAPLASSVAPSVGPIVTERHESENAATSEALIRANPDVAAVVVQQQQSALLPPYPAPIVEDADVDLSAVRVHRGIFSLYDVCEVVGEVNRDVARSTVNRLLSGQPRLHCIRRYKFDSGVASMGGNLQTAIALCRFLNINNLASVTDALKELARGNDQHNMVARGIKRPLCDVGDIKDENERCKVVCKYVALDYQWNVHQLDEQKLTLDKRRLSFKNDSLVVEQKAIDVGTNQLTLDKGKVALEREKVAIEKEKVAIDEHQINNEERRINNEERRIKNKRQAFELAKEYNQYNLEKQLGTAPEGRTVTTTATTPQQRQQQSTATNIATTTEQQRGEDETESDEEVAEPRNERLANAREFRDARYLPTPNGCVPVARIGVDRVVYFRHSRRASLPTDQDIITVLGEWKVTRGDVMGKLGRDTTSMYRDCYKGMAAIYSNPELNFVADY